MRESSLLLLPLIVVSMALFSCDASTDSSRGVAQDAAAEDEAYQDEYSDEEADYDQRQDEEDDESKEGDWNEEGLTDAERMRRAAIAAGLPMSEVEVPEISARTYTTGHITVKVSGFFEIDASPALDTKASISDGGYTWIQYGASGEAAPNVTVTIGNGDIGINVAVGKYGATGGTTDCTVTTDVTPSRVSGHFSCAKVTGYNQADRNMGDVSIEVDFEANS